jgi:hypothetical protein
LNELYKINESENENTPKSAALLKNYHSNNKSGVFGSNKNLEM